jgi:hypothetical protein
MKDKTSVFLKSTVNNGLIFGVIMIIVQLTFWMFNIMPVGIGKSFLLLLFNLAIYTIGLWWFTKTYRDTVLGGVIKYGQAYLYGLMVCVFSTILLIIYNFIFNKFIDPEYLTRVLKATADWTEEFMKGKGVSNDQISAAVDKIMAKAHPTEISTAIKTFTGGVIMGAIVSLISAGIAKKVEDPFKENKI